MGETRVDLLRLLQDLADAYPGELEETMLTEIVANSLDSRATAISLATDAASATLTVTDDGRGMRRADLRRFHDIAASTKERGQGIGFAGVGIKLGLLVGREVVTETRRGKEHIATSWALTNRQRALWRWIEAPGLVGEHGTAVRLFVDNALSPLLDPAYLEAALRRHFEPLFDPAFDEVLSPHYPGGIRFAIDGRDLPRSSGANGERTPIGVHFPRKRTAAAVGYLARHAEPVAEDLRGIAVSTFGKVIKRGWDWLGLSAGSPDLVTGLIEAPGLAGALTLNKADFLRAGPRGAVYLAYRKAAQEAVSQRVAAWGDGPAQEERSRTRVARPVERDVETVLVDLADRFPLLAMLVERRRGGQRKLWTGEARGGSLGEQAASGLIVDSLSPGPPLGDSVGRPESAMSDGADDPLVHRAEAPPDGTDAARGTAPGASVELPARKGRRRPTRLGLTILFESRPDDPDLGRLVDTTVWVNDAHPAYQRAVAMRAESYHLALSVAMALSRVAVDAAQEHAFVSAFLARWGHAQDRPPVARRRRRKGRS